MTQKPKPRGLLLDLDGVFYVGDTLIDGARQTIEFLRQQGIPHRYITNTTTLSQRALQTKLSNLGLPVEAREILSAPQAALLYLKNKGIQSAYLLLRDEVKKDFSEITESCEKPQAVVIGDIDDAWDYNCLNQAFKHIQNGAELIALHKNKFWQTPDGLRLDIGAFVAGLEYATGITATVVGKPSHAFFEQALKALELPAEKVAMIGDDIDSDVGGAQRSGITGILVKTGKYREAYAAASDIKPDLILPSIKQLPEQLFSSNGIIGSMDPPH